MYKHGELIIPTRIVGDKLFIDCDFIDTPVLVLDGVYKGHINSYEEIIRDHGGYFIQHDIDGGFILFTGLEGYSNATLYIMEGNDSDGYRMNLARCKEFNPIQILQYEILYDRGTPVQVHYSNEYTPTHLRAFLCKLGDQLFTVYYNEGFNVSYVENESSINKQYSIKEK